MKVLQIALWCILGNMSLFAQSSTETIQAFLNEKQQELNLTLEDIKGWTITSQHTSKQSGATHIYIQQLHQGIPIFNGIANFAIKDGKVFSMGNRLLDHIAQNSKYTTPSIRPKQAILLAAKALELSTPVQLKTIEALSNKHFIYNKGSISTENIPIQLMYFETKTNQIRLVWDLSIYTLDAEHWWSVRIDAQTGELLDQIDWITHCQFEGSPFTKCKHLHRKPLATQAPEKTLAPNQYSVFALPTESPAHGTRSVLTNPSNAVASPFGWHDTDGSTGAEYTITRGNNVFAYEDTSNANGPGYSPNGGAILEFNFPYTNGSQPTTYIDAAITNLFYMNNMMHDIWHGYGFDEASGNFQQNNYNNGGQAGDYVRAETQDGSGVNNANFATPPDGFRPRMQMYIWPFSSNTGHFLTVNSPSNLAGTYLAASASFGPALPALPITADVVLLEDAVAPINDGCDPVVNAAQLSGKIVFIDQGICDFTDKVLAAQNAGAVAVVLVNNLGFLFVVGGTPSSPITIPTIMILPASANAIKAALATGPVSVSIDNAGISNKDSDLDNGIIAHEYGHGISTRLTGGGSNSGCLRNAEQMGEGWSDWFGLMLTLEPGDLGTDVRGIGTYVRGEPNTGPGIRPAPYSTDFAVNPFTYGNSNNTAAVSQPHGVGFIFATALWDLNWALVDLYGGTPDPDLYNGTGGNNIAMNLVIEGLKLQPCNPGMIDGRDAILLADQLIYNGIHECLIWEVFAKRGFGYSASQGSSASRVDQIEAFDLSPVCMVAAAPPFANFAPSSLNSCVSTVSFKDSSTSTPQQWLWNFGDGATSTQQNPSHAYLSDGVYDVRLLVTNNMGSDSMIQQITITLPPPPIAIGDEVCAGDSALLVATGTGTIQWKSISNNILTQGDTLWVPNVGSIQTYYAENLTGAPAQFIGATDSSIGAGNIDNSPYAALNFRADQPLEIVSTWVYAQTTGLRTFFLAQGENTTGAIPTLIIDDVTVFLQPGWQEVPLNLMVPDTGNYNLGGETLNLYANATGAAYPYAVPGLISINSSSSTTAPNDSYYYFYNLQVREPRCISPKDTATAVPVSSYFTYTDNSNTFTFINGSSGATSWLWNFGDGNTSTQQNPVHTYANGNAYTVTLTINGGSCTSTQIINGILGLNNPTNDKPMLTLMPNPASSWAQLNLDKAANEDLTIQISAVDGRVLQTATLKQGVTAFTLNLEQLPSAIYFVSIYGLNFSEVRKLVKE
jgi:PKD repeat protein